MTGDRKLEHFRQWALAVLRLLSATSARQVAYLQESGVGADELLLRFDDLLHVARARVADGSLRQEDFLLLMKVNERVDAVNAGPDSVWDRDALETASEWTELRIAAGEVESSFRNLWNADAGV